MSNPAKRRILQDIKKINVEAALLGIFVKPNPNNIMEWEGVIFGPDDTEWEGGVFRLRIKIPDDYPNKPPTVEFTNRMFHPNIYNNGAICLDLLQKGWSALYDCLAVLKSIQALLTDPNPKSPANNEAAKLYDENKQEYYRRVRECVESSWIVDY